MSALAWTVLVVFVGVLFALASYALGLALVDRLPG